MEKVRSSVIEELAWLALAVDDLDTSAAFYTDVLDLAATDHDSPHDELHLDAGTSALHLRGPSASRSGGDHVHYAFETGRDSLKGWKTRLEAIGPVETHDFGVYRSLYVFDPDDHCVELGGRTDADRTITGIFEIVLEVEDLERAEGFYTTLGCSILDRGFDRRRVRLDAGPFELELWEPQTGLADAKPGSNVELGIVVTDPEKTLQTAKRVGATIDGTDITDPDGHRLVLNDP